MVKSNEDHISALLAVADVLENHPAEIRTLEVSIYLEMHTNSTADTILKSLATTHLAHAFSTFIKRGWPTCFKTLVLIWFCKGEGASNSKNIDATDLLTRLPSALRTYKNPKNMLPAGSLIKLEADISRLIEQGAILSAWRDQSQDPNRSGRKRMPFLEGFASHLYGHKKVFSLLRMSPCFLNNRSYRYNGKECRRRNQD